MNNKEKERTEVIRIKDIQSMLKVSHSQAQRVYADIKKECNVHYVLFEHFKEYFNLK